MEFHFPYYTLREHIIPINDPRKLRRCGIFIRHPLAPHRTNYLYEAQISVLITGIDEWFWTAYCCTDTYYGSQKSIQGYHAESLDPLTGGERPTYFPVWNPREYFLYILARRFRQATKEWSVVIRALEDRLQSHVSWVSHLLREIVLYYLGSERISDHWTRSSNH